MVVQAHDNVSKLEESKDQSVEMIRKPGKLERKMRNLSHVHR